MTDDDQSGAGRRARGGDWQKVFSRAVYQIFRVSILEDRGAEYVNHISTEATGQLQHILKRELPRLSLLFHHGGIFANGILLKAGRSMYQDLDKVEAFLAKFRCNEIVIDEGLERSDVTTLIDTLRQMERGRAGAAEPITISDNITLRYANPGERLGVLEPLTGQRPLEVRIARYYAACLRTLRQFSRDEGPQRFALLRDVKRIAQVLVHLSGRSRPAMLSLTGLPVSQDEPAGVVLNSAILAVLMARRLTGRIDILRRICFAALVVDHHQANVDAPEGESSETPAANASAILRNARPGKTAIRRAIATYEANYLIEHGPSDLPYDDDISPKVETLLVQVARRYTRLAARPRDEQRRRPPNEIIQAILERSETQSERVVLHLLVDTLGLFTRAMPVELSSGWRGVVLESTNHITDFHLPRVRLARTPEGDKIEPRDVDLAEELDEEEYGYVLRRVETDDAYLDEIVESMIGEKPGDGEA